MCGFFHSSRATVPLIRTSLDVSNMDMLWCASTGATKMAVAASPASAAGRRLMAEPPGKNPRVMISRSVLARLVDGLDCEHLDGPLDPRQFEAELILQCCRKGGHTRFRCPGRQRHAKRFANGRSETQHELPITGQACLVDDRGLQNSRSQIRNSGNRPAAATGGQHE